MKWNAVVDTGAAHLGEQVQLYLRIELVQAAKVGPREGTSPFP